MNHVLPRASPYAVVVVREEKRDFPGSWVHHHRRRLPLSPCTSSITSGHHLQSFKLGDGAIVTELMDAVAMPISVHIQSLFLLLFFSFLYLISSFVYLVRANSLSVFDCVERLFVKG